jgi:hypothetical protein
MTAAMLEGALILLAGILLGRFLPGRRKGPRPPKPVEAVCGCTHHHAVHDPKTGACNASVPVNRYSKSGDWTGHDYRPCACVNYSGPLPLPEYFAPEIATDQGEANA